MLCREFLPMLNFKGEQVKGEQVRVPHVCFRTQRNVPVQIVNDEVANLFWVPIPETWELSGG